MADRTTDNQTGRQSGKQTDSTPKIVNNDRQSWPIFKRIVFACLSVRQRPVTVISCFTAEAQGTRKAGTRPAQAFPQ